jgi:SRSO17 transposase
MITSNRNGRNTMRLLQSALSRLKQTKQPQDKFVTHRLGLLLMLPGHATFRNLSRYSPYHERTFSRWYGRVFDWVSLNKSAITEVVPAEHEQAMVMDASFVPKSGKHTYGLARFWNGSHSRAERGLEISTLAWLDITDNCAYGLSVEQTPPSADTSDPEATRMDVYLDQLSRVVKAHDLKLLRYVITDGAYSKQKFVAGVRALGLHQIGKWRADAHLRYLYQGPKRPGPGRQKTYDGKVNWSDLSRFERLSTEDEHIVLYHHVLNHVPVKRNLQVVVVVPSQRKRYAVLFSTDVDLDPLTLYRYSKARFQVEFLFRDAKQFAGLSDCQGRSKAKLDFHFNASLSAVTFAKLEARHQHGNGDQAFSMASLKRRAFNQHLIERICEHLANGQSLDKSSPDYEALCNYGIITDEAA